MSRNRTSLKRSVRVIGLLALIIPVLLGTVPGLHAHALAGCDTHLPTASESTGSVDECPFCALSRIPGQGASVDTADTDFRSTGDAPAPLSEPPAQAPPASDAPPRAPPV